MSFLTCKFCQVFVHKLSSFILVCSVLPCTGPDESWHEIYRPLKQFLPLFPSSLSVYRPQRTCLPSPFNVTFDLGNIYPSGVQRVLCCILPNKTSCGSDKISYRMMKEAGQGLVGRLVSLFNASVRLRQVPDEWQKAIIKPIFKGGKKDRRNPSSYRPISLASCVARTMEKQLSARIFEYLKQNLLLYQHQSGFQQNHSTVTQLCFLVHQWHMALEEGAIVQSVFLDLSKAYDRIANSLSDRF